MSFTVQAFPVIVFLIVGLVSLDGMNPEYLKTLENMEQGPVLITSFGKLNLKTENHRVFKPIIFPQNSFQTSQGIRQGQETIIDVEKAKVMKRRQCLDDIQLDQEVTLGLQSSTTVEDEKKWKLAEQFQSMEHWAQKTPTKNLGHHIFLKMMVNGSNFGSAVVKLQKRGERQYAESYEAENDRQKKKDSQPNSSTASKLMEMIQPITGAFSKAKHKMKPSPSMTRPISKTKKSFSIGLTGDKKVKTGLEKGLTSGYTSKPSGIGGVLNEYHPNRMDLDQTVKRRGPQLFGGKTRHTDAVEMDERSPPRSPSKSTEVRKIWTFIERVSKKIAETGEVLANNDESEQSKQSEKSEQSEQSETTQESGSQSPERITPTVYPGNERKDYLMVSETPPTVHYFSPNIKTHEYVRAEIESEEDGKIIDYIIRCKQIWTSSAAVSAQNKDIQSPPDRSWSSKTSRPSPQSPPGSPPGPPAWSPPKSPPLSPLRSPLNSKPMSPPRIASFNQPAPSNQLLLSSSIPANPRQQLRTLSNKEINEQYAVLAKRIRSSERLEQESEE